MSLQKLQTKLAERLQATQTILNNPTRNYCHMAIASESGVGKTILSATAPKPVVFFSMDVGGKDSLRNLVYPHNQIFVEDLERSTWEEFFDILAEYGLFDGFETIVFDVSSLFEKAIYSLQKDPSKWDKLAKNAGRKYSGDTSKILTEADYALLGKMMKVFFQLCERITNKHILYNCHLLDVYEDGETVGEKIFGVGRIATNYFVNNTPHIAKIKVKKKTVGAGKTEKQRVLVFDDSYFTQARLKGQELAKPEYLIKNIYNPNSKGYDLAEIFEQLGFSHLDGDPIEL